MTKDKVTGDYAVGYGKPPRHTQFQPGQSANPKGRPRGARGLKSDLMEELAETVSVTQNGKVKKHRKQRLVIKSLVNSALQGNVKSQQLLLGHIAQHVGVDDRSQGTRHLSAADQKLLDELLGEVAPMDVGSDG